MRANPLFPHDIWNVYDRVVGGLSRTTNSMEGWHNAFRRSVGQSHAHVWKFLSCLKRENEAMHLKIAQYVAGDPVTPRSRVYRQLNERIDNIVQDYRNRNIIDYLRAISYSIA